MPATISKFAFPRSESFPETVRRAFGANHDSTVDALDSVLQSAVDKRDGIEADVMPLKRPAARKIAAPESYARTARVLQTYCAPLAQKLEDTRGRVGLSRRLNPTDLPQVGAGFAQVDQANRIHQIRMTLPTLTDNDLIGIVRDAFAPTEGEPDLETSYAIDSEPPWIREAIEKRAAVSIEDLRSKLLARRNPEAAAAFTVVEYITDQAHYLCQRALRVLESTWGVDATIDNAQANALQPVIDELQRALRKKPA